MSADHSAQDIDEDDVYDNVAAQTRARKAEPAPVVHEASELVELLEKFRAAHPKDWLLQIKQDTATQLGPLTVKEWAVLLKSRDLDGWETYLPEDERDVPPLRFSEFAQMALPKIKGAPKQKKTGWKPDPKFTVQFEEVAKPAHRKTASGHYQPKKFNEESYAAHILQDVGDTDVVGFDPDAETEIQEKAQERLEKAKELAPKRVQRALKKEKKQLTAAQNKAAAPKPEKKKNRIKRITVEMIKQAAIAYRDAHPQKEWPNLNSGKINVEPLNDGYLTWARIHDYIVRKSHGLTAKNCKYSSLANLIDDPELRKPKIKKEDLTYELILEAARETATKTGKAPMIESGQVMFGRLASYNITWSAINFILRKPEKYPGLKDCPHKTLKALCEGENIGNRIEKPRLSVWAIRVSAFMTWLKSFSPEHPFGRWPAVHDGVVLYGPAADGQTTWSRIDDALRNEERGLTRDKCPYSTLNSLLIGEGMAFVKAPLTIENILASAKATYFASLTQITPYGRWPTAADGYVMHGPLSDGVTTWDAINQAIDKKTGGLTAENCPYKSLAKLLEAYGLKKPYRAPKATPELSRA